MRTEAFPLAFDLTMLLAVWAGIILGGRWVWRRVRRRADRG